MNIFTKNPNLKYNYFFFGGGGGGRGAGKGGAGKGGGGGSVARVSDFFYKESKSKNYFLEGVGGGLGK